MPKVQHVKARKDYPEHGIVKGDMCYVWSLKTGPSSSRNYRQKMPPKPQQLTTSDFLIQAYDLDDRIADLAADSESFEDDARGIADDIRALGEEQQEKLDGMPEGLQQGPTGETLQARIDHCESLASEIENVLDNWSAPEKGDEDAEGEDPETEEHFAERLADAQGERREEVTSIGSVADAG